MVYKKFATGSRSHLPTSSVSIACPTVAKVLDSYAEWAGGASSVNPVHLLGTAEGLGKS